MHLRVKQASGFWLQTGPVTVKRFNIPGRWQPRLENGSPCHLY